MKKVILILTVLVQVSGVFSQTHFVKGYTGTNPYEPMAIVIKSADIGGVPLQINDEIAVFDGNLCVGVLVLTGVLDPNNSATWKILSSSADNGVDGLGNPLLNGFTSGNTIYYRFWDSNENKEYHNVVATYHNTSNVVISPQPFANTGGAFVLLSTANTTKTWTNNSLPVWSDPDAWLPIGVPEPNHDVVIPVGTNVPSISASVKAICGSLTINNNLNILSTASGAGSLIVAADISGSATVNSRRYMSGGAWHLISSPLSSVQTIGDFLKANGAISTNGASRGMMKYSESIDDWSGYFDDNNSDELSLGKGYGIRTDAANFVTFSGSITNSNLTPSVTRTATPGNGWNLIGNPYTSAIYTKQQVFGFLTVNAGAIDDNCEAIYLWDQGTDAYTVINLDEGDARLASGQGFFIKAASSGTVSFSKTMQVHKTDAPFKSAVVPNPNVVLTAKSGDIYSSTKINFIEGMTLGLDRGHDAGILRSSNGFDIYSRLVADNGVDFMVQALPGKSNEKYVIPIGVDASKGGEIIFSSRALNLPLGYQVIIEDKLTKSHTDINDVTERYVTNLASDSKGIGRFYLHVGASLQTAIKEIQQNNFLVYTIDQTVYIKGNVGNNTKFAVYSVDGRLMNRFGAKSQTLNQMSVAGYTPGVYFIKVHDKNNYSSVKFIVGN